MICRKFLSISFWISQQLIQLDLIGASTKYENIIYIAHGPRRATRQIEILF